jgi:hypothetical protein
MLMYQAWLKFVLNSLCLLKSKPIFALHLRNGADLADKLSKDNHIEIEKVLFLRARVLYHHG